VAEVPGLPVVAGATELVLVPLEAVGGAGVCCAAAQDVTMRATAASRLKARTRNDTVKWVLQEGPAGPRRTDLARTMTWAEAAPVRLDDRARCGAKYAAPRAEHPRSTKQARPASVSG
jgi:hypothetical protein